MKSQADVLIVTVTKVESQAVLETFTKATGKKPASKPIGLHTYRDFGKINGAQVFMVMSEMGAGGLGASLQTVGDGIRALSPWAVIMVGIAFGVNSTTQKIGDILVAKQLVNYEPEAVRHKAIPRGSKVDVSTALLNRFKDADLDWDKAPENKAKARVRFGLILSGEKLIDNFPFLQELLDKWPEAIGGEMEGAGLYAACQEAKKDWILVKSICDWADGHKEEDREERQKLAAYNSARFLLYMLNYAPFIQQADELAACPEEKAEPFKRTLTLKSARWEHNYKENGDLEALLIYQVLNETPYQITDLIPIRASWFAHNIKYSQGAEILGKDKDFSNLSPSLFTPFEHIRPSPSGKDQPTTTFLWFPEIRPPLEPGKELGYVLKITTEGTEKEVFSDTGSYAGMAAPRSCERLSCRINAPPGFVIALKNFVVRNAVGNVLESSLAGPSISPDKSYLTWEVEEPIPEARYDMSIRIQKAGAS
jgi:nucleoside phosphorylase